MPRPKRKYSTPVVVTVAALAGCGGEVHESTDERIDVSNPPFPESNIEQPGGGTTGWTGGAGGTGGSPMVVTGGTGGWDDPCAVVSCNPPPPDQPCEQERLGIFNSCFEGERCVLPMTCTSGLAQEFGFVCERTGDTLQWVLAPHECGERQAEQCLPVVGGSVRIDCYNESYRATVIHGGSNPPAPCPQSEPALGEACDAGSGFGADPSNCGYPCEGDGWHRVGCDYDSSQWQETAECTGVGGSAGGPGN